MKERLCICFLRPTDLPLVKMYPVSLVAARTRGGNVRFRVAEGDGGAGHDGLWQTELDYLIYNDPLAYAELILNGETEEYLRNVAGSHGLED